MKTLILILGLAALGSCYSHRELQVEVVNAELVKIDTVYRMNDQQKQLTWKCNDNIEYVSYASLKSQYIVGTRMTVFRTR